MKKLLGGKLKYLIIFAVLGTAGLSIFLAKSCLSGSENTRFEKYIDKIFYQEISSNTLNLHYTLAYPEDYGIRDYQISLGTFEPKALEDDLIRTEKLNKELERFDSARLSQENRIIYDILSLEFSSRLSLGQNYLLQASRSPWGQILAFRHSFLFFWRNMPSALPQISKIISLFWPQFLNILKESWTLRKKSLKKDCL